MPKMECKQRRPNRSSSLICFPIENPGLCTVQEVGNDDGPVYLELRRGAEQVTLPSSLWQSSKGTGSFGQAVVKILADCGIIGDDATQVSEVFKSVFKSV